MTIPMDKSLSIVLFIFFGSISRVQSFLRLLIVFPNCPPERLYLFTLPPAGSRRAHFPTSLLTSSFIKYYILYLFNPGLQLLFFFLLSWRQWLLAQGTGNRFWERLQVGNCDLSLLQQILWFPRFSRRPFFENLCPCLW